MGPAAWEGLYVAFLSFKLGFEDQVGMVGESSEDKKTNQTKIEEVDDDNEPGCIAGSL